MPTYQTPILLGIALLGVGFFSSPVYSETFDSNVMKNRDMIYKSLIISDEDDLRFYASDSRKEKVWDEYLGFTELLDTIARWKKQDPLYPRKREQMFRALRSLVGKAPPQQWAERMREIYKKIAPY